MFKVRYLDGTKELVTKLTIDDVRDSNKNLIKDGFHPVDIIPIDY